MFFCEKCNGRILLDKAYCYNDNIELFCIECGKRWTLGNMSTVARFINRIEKRRERMTYYGLQSPELLLSSWQTV